MSLLIHKEQNGERYRFGFKLRYYTYKKNYDLLVLNLLEEIRKRYSVEYTVKEVKLVKSDSGDLIPDEKHEREIYEEEVVPRAKVIKARVGEDVKCIFRSRRGRGHYYIAGRIVVTNLYNQVEWVPYVTDPYYEVWSKYDRERPTTIGFLKWILDEGTEALRYIDSKISKKPKDVHELLIEEFIKRRIIEGSIRREVPVGGVTLKTKHGYLTKLWSLKVDLIVHEPSGYTWIIEVEPELNATALGQVLIYKELYLMENKGRHVKTAIVCAKAKAMLKSIIEKYVDKVIILPIKTR